MIRIVYVLRGSFFPAFNGARVKTAALASALAAFGELTVIDLGRGHFPGPRFPTGQRFNLPFGGEANFYSSVRVTHPWAELVSKLTGAPYHPPRLWRPKSARRRVVLDLIRSLNPDVVVVDQPTMTQLALDSAARRRIVHTHNLESQLAWEVVAKTGKWRHRQRALEYERIESELLPRVDQVWGVREEDLAIYRKLGVKRAVLTPNVITDTVFQQQPVDGRPNRVAMFGWLAYGPNADAARYLVGLGQRAAAARRPLEIVVAGGDPQPDLLHAAGEFPWLQVPGFVASLRSVVDEAAAIAVPLAWGGGTKLKVVEALAMCKPLITTPVGAEGLKLVDGVHALIRPLGAEFDRAVAEIAREPARYREMAQRGRDFAWQRYSQTSLTRIVAQALQLGGAAP